MKMLAAFTVEGLPAPQGSKTAVMWGDRPGLIEGGSKVGRAKHKAWREAVEHVASQVRADEPYDGPLSVSVDFRMPMPKSRPAAVKRAGIGWHSVKPDKDKLLRSTLDGLTAGGLIADDARVARILLTATETTGQAGADIVVHQLKSVQAEPQGTDSAS